MPLGRAVAFSFPSLVLATVAFAAAPAAPAGPVEAVAATVRALEQAAGVPPKVTHSPVNGLVSFLTLPAGHAVPVTAADGSAEARALAFLDAYGRAFGPEGRAAVRVEKVERDELGLEHVRLRQVHRGVPVTAGELVVHLSAKGVVAVNGEALDGLADLSVEPRVSAATAQSIAREHLARKLELGDFELSEPRLEVFNRGLLESRWQPTRLAWFMEATAPALRQFVWVDARRGQVLLDFSQLGHALSRRIHTSASTATLPGTLIRSEGGPATGDLDADAAYLHAGDSYNYFLLQHGRDSYNGAGAPVVSSVHFCPLPTLCPYPNGFWNLAPSSQMVFGDGYSRADDVVGHEFAHGVIEHEANLYFYMQSGALNESYADIFGETIDLVNGRGTDTPPVRWLMGEDIPGTGSQRNMYDPTTHGHPGKMTDPQFVCSDPADPGADLGGIHENNGVPNHAYALMVDGGTYNGHNILAINAEKAGKIEYRALSFYLTSGSDFLDNYNAISQSCADLNGTFGITAANCAEVGKAIDAVQMFRPWPCSPPQPVVPAFCPPLFTVNNVFLDTFEAGFGNWLTTTTTGDNVWFPASHYATSQPNSFLGVDNGDADADDSAAFMANPVALPAGARLQFNHSYGFDDEAGVFFDGGVIEYSTDGGTWLDARPLITAGANYSGTLAPGNPLSPRSAFVGESWGYTASQLNLASLAGQSVRFRFRIGTNAGGSDYGWFIDDFRIYTCVPPPPPVITMTDVAIREGNSGNVVTQVTARLSYPPTSTVTVQVSTTDGTATAGADYVSGSGTLTFLPGVTVVSANLTVLGDTVPEGNETFFLTLSNPVGATIGDPEGEIRIMDDEASKFFTVPPCRAADTRNPPGPSGAPQLYANITRYFPAAGLCGVPGDAKAVAINLTVVAATQPGNLRLHAGSAVPTIASNLNFVPFHTRANNAVVSLGALGQIAVAMDMPPLGTVGFAHFIFDIYGYYR